jgi:hypothetical protein
VFAAARGARGIDEYDELIQIPGFGDFVVHYTAEGYKRRRNTVSICNSDPPMVARIGVRAGS